MQVDHGFVGVLEEIAVRCRRMHNLKEVSHDVLTLGGRLPFHLGVKSLTDGDRAVLELFGELPVHAALSVAEGMVWQVSIQIEGKILLRPRKLADNDVIIIGYFVISDECYQMLQSRIATLSKIHASCDVEVKSFFEVIDPTALQEVLKVVRDAIDHIDQVLFYICDDTFTNQEGHNTLMHRTSPDAPGYLVPRLFDTPIGEWSWTEKQFVFCIYWIKQAGLRGEEFNGQQLTASTLHALLLDKQREYSDWLVENKLVPSPCIAILARQVGNLRERMKNAYNCSRWIQGLTFYKEERWLSPSSHIIPHEIPEDLRYFIASVYGVKVDCCIDAKHYFQEVINAALEISVLQGQCPDMSGVETLMIGVLDSAIRSTDSDMAMSRGVRDLARWLLAWREKQYMEICTWSTSAYYCGVTTSDRYNHSLTSTELGKALVAVAKRMQFNSWHYAPSHVPPDKVPDGRHFFWAPSMPDRTEWSDQHHMGHKLVGTRHALRLPYPLVLSGQSFSGLGDIRLMRKSGSPYSEREFSLGLIFAEYLRLINQGICDRISDGISVNPIVAFTDEWYKVYARYLIGKQSVPQLMLENESR